MSEQVRDLGGLRTTIVEVSPAPTVAVVVLHGHAMRPEDFVPFARSMGVAAHYYFPQGPVDAEPTGHCWWPIDQERRTAALARGPRDLNEEDPEGVPPARALLAALVREVREVRAAHPALPLALVGFSQGGMLACDAVLTGAIAADGLALLSSSRIANARWMPARDRLAPLSILVSHGEADADLAFDAGRRLADFCAASGARVTWVPFPGGHEVPLAVWRRLKTFLVDLRPAGARNGP